MRCTVVFGLVLGLVAGLGLTGCPSPPRTSCPGCDGGVGLLTLAPATAVVLPGQSQAFTARGPTGSDVTAQAEWSLSDPTMGTIDHGQYTAPASLPHGAAVQVIATLDGQRATAQVSLPFRSEVADPSAPAGAADAFDGPPSTDVGETPALLYPLDGALVAKNLGQLNLQWQASPVDQVFRVHATGELVDVTLYVGPSRCASGVECQLQPEAALWQALALSSAGRELTLTVDGTEGPGQPVARSLPVRIRFSPEDVSGGLYYFSPTISGLRRLPFGAAQAVDFTSSKVSSCVGCHALSRDGKRVAAVLDYADGRAAILDGADGSKLLTTPAAAGGNFFTFSPDGTEYVSNWAGLLTLRSSADGSAIKEIPKSYYGGKAAVMPEWSPDGESLTFVAVPPEGLIGKDNGTLEAGDWITTKSGSIMVMPVNGGEFGPAVAVAPSVLNQEYNFYPTWSPDSEWIAFATSRFPGSSQTAAHNSGLVSFDAVSYDQQSARLRLVRRSGGPIIELGRASHQLDRAATWPKFAPFVQGSLVFLTFNARFAYGFVVPDNARPQLWMSAIDLSRAGTDDPSYAPFWLPFQDPQSSNHLGIWTTAIACTDGQSGDCPAGYLCQDGSCVANIQ